MLRSITGLGLTLGFLLFGAVPAAAQFGSNKVQYDDLEFQVLRTPHFEIHYYPSEREAVQQAARMAERWYARLAQALDHEFAERRPLVFYTSHSDFRQTTVVSGFVPEGVAGVTEHRKGRVAMPFAAGLGETDHVLGHELVHAFQEDILDRMKRSIAVLPSWFVEGMAEYLSIGRIDTQTALWLRDAALEERLPTIAQLDDPKWFPYRYGQALWSYLAGRFGEDVVRRALKARVPGGAVGRITAVTGIDADTLSKDWHRAIMAMVHGGSRQPFDGSRMLVGGDRESGRLNIAPALSPDGQELIFLSERAGYSVDVYLADAATGAIKRRLIRAAANPDFDSLQFIASTGAWDRSGKRFALAAIRSGKPVITILQTATGSVEREIELPQLDEVFNPSWAPDGRRLAVSAMKGGVSDIYVVDVQTAAVRALTSDPYADLHPAWSPDGRLIAFATERFSSSMETLSFGNYRLATVDPASGSIAALPDLPHAHHMDPHWSADGTRLLFLADGGGRRNVYRLQVATGVIHQLTDVATGISGISALSPALSVAQSADVMAFSVYRRGAYELHVMPHEGATTVGSASAMIAAVTPLAAPRGAIAPPTFGLLDGRDFVEQPYDAGLRLNRIGQPYLTAGGGSFGSFLRAGVAISFEDLLSEHSLRTALQVGKEASDFGAQVAYMNRQSRWNWALVGEHVPMQFSISRSTVGAAGHERALTVEDIRIQQTHRQLGGSIFYPFSRARRLELGTAVHTIDVQRTIDTAVYSTATGDLLGEASEQIRRPRLTLFEPTAAFVHDTAVFGPASPVLGKRIRLELSPTFGDLNFTTVTADYRRYDSLRRPFTLAVRARHVGRYGPDAGDSRLVPLGRNVGALVRGHSSRSLVRTCGAEATVECEAAGHLGTSRLFLTNLELRFPVLGLLRGTGSYGPLPVEGFAFADAAWMWNPALESAARRSMLGSAGAGARVNVRGFVFEGALARPFNAPSPGWRFAFNLRRGF